MLTWHILAKGDNKNYQYVGSTEGITLEKAIMNGMLEDDEFKSSIREIFDLDSNYRVEIFGFPEKQLRSTKMKSNRLSYGHP